MDILDHLEKLEALVRHDDEARTICSDARAEIVKLRGTGNAGAAANAASVPPGYAYSWVHGARQLAAPMPPSRNTQVKWAFSSLDADLVVNERGSLESNTQVKMDTFYGGMRTQEEYDRIRVFLFGDV